MKKEYNFGMKKILIALIVIIIILLTYIALNQKQDVATPLINNPTPTETTTEDKNLDINASNDNKEVKKPIAPLVKEIKTEQDALKRFAELGHNSNIDDLRYFDTTNPAAYVAGIPDKKIMWGIPITEMRTSPSDNSCLGKTYLFIDVKTGSLIGEYFLIMGCA